MAFTDNQKKINLRNVEQPSTLHEAGDKLGAYYLADNPKYFEPQRDNSFLFYIEGLSNKLSIPHNIYAQANADEILKLSVKASSVPKLTTEPITINRGTSQMHFAGKSTFGSGKFVVNDYIGAGTKDILYAWRKNVYDAETEKTGLASDYKVDAYLLEYTPEYQLVRTWALKGCWPSDISESDYDYETSNNRTVEVTFYYDKAFIDNSDLA